MTQWNIKSNCTAQPSQSLRADNGTYTSSPHSAFSKPNIYNSFAIMSYQALVACCHDLDISRKLGSSSRTASGECEQNRQGTEPRNRPFGPLCPDTNPRIRINLHLILPLTCTLGATQWPRGICKVLERASMEECEINAGEEDLNRKT